EPEARRHASREPWRLGAHVHLLSIPAALMTLPHLSISLRMKAAYSFDELPTISAPRLSSSLRTSGSFNARMVSLCRRCRIAGGVPSGADRPHQGETSNPGTVSATVGRSGAPGERFRPVVAKPFSLPART